MGLKEYVFKIHIPKGKKFLQEKIFANLPLIRAKKFHKIYQKFPNRENFFRKISQK